MLQAGLVKNAEIFVFAIMINVQDVTNNASIILEPAILYYRSNNKCTTTVVEGKTMYEAVQIVK